MTDNPPASGRLEPLAYLGVVSPPLPQDIRVQSRRGRRRQDGRWGGVVGPDLCGLRCYRHRGGWMAWPLGCSRPQGHHRRDQPRRHHQVSGQEHDPEPAIPGWLGQLHHHAPCCARSVQLPTDLPARASPTSQAASCTWPCSSGDGVRGALERLSPLSGPAPGRRLTLDRHGEAMGPMTPRWFGLTGGRWPWC